MFVAIVVIEHALVPRLHPADYMISEYANAGGVAGVAGAIALAAWGASFLATAPLALQSREQAGRVYAWRGLALLLAIAGLGLVVAAACPTQAVRGVVPSSVVRTASGRLHDLGGGAGQLAIFGAAIVSAHLLAGDRRFRRATIALIVIGLTLGPTLAVLGASTRGLRQRALVAAACAWQLGLIAILDSRARPRRARSDAGWRCHVKR